MKNLFKIFFLLLFVVVKPVFAQQDVYTQKSLAGALSDKVNPIDVGSLTVDAKKDKHLLKYLNKFVRLNYLEIKNCDTLPIGVFALKFVKHIRLKKINYITNGSYENLQYLTKLEIDSSDIVDLPDDFGKLPTLKVIIIQNSNLKKFPSSLAKNISLEVIELPYNKIMNIPPVISNLKLLQILNLSSNNISIIPKEISSLKILQVLNLSNNNISLIPKEIGNLTILSELQLESNPISLLPIEIATIKSLNFLNVVGTKIPPLARVEFKKKCINKEIVIPRF